MRAARKPKQGGRIPQAAAVAKGMRHGLEVLVSGKNPLRSNEPADLKNQRVEGGKINTGECAQEEPAWNQAIDRTTLRVKKPSDGGPIPIHERQPLYGQKRTQIWCWLAAPIRFALASASLPRASATLS